MVTPVTAGGELDELAVRRILDRFVENQLGVFVLGTTGEAASVPPEMRRRLVQLATEHVRGRVLVYAGIGDNCVSNSIKAAAEYRRAGVDAVVALLPSYYLLEAEEIRRYFEHVAQNVSGPVLVYNIPQTTRMSVPVEIVEALSGIPNIIGLKDSENAPGRFERIAEIFGDRKDFALFAGVASLSVKALRLGFTGLVPSSGNLVQVEWRELLEHARQGRWAEAEELQVKLNAVAAIFQSNRSLGQSLAALKAAMDCRGLCGPEVLPPLQRIADPDRARIKAQLEELELKP
ncbi:MAG: dihydrodipicolinate synthase family protein [Verrucomicrobia bacterium]|nr:dihydrodipicolinate synthase family protein [Verrucomicrobiota bacterium]